MQVKIGDYTYFIRPEAQLGWSRFLSSITSADYVAIYDVGTRTSGSITIICAHSQSYEECSLADKAGTVLASGYDGDETSAFHVAALDLDEIIPGVIGLQHADDVFTKSFLNHIVLQDRPEYIEDLQIISHTVIRPRGAVRSVPISFVLVPNNQKVLVAGPCYVQSQTIHQVWGL